MIRLQNLTLQRGPQRLLEDAELTLHAGHKAGLIGANGAGKSSLFALLRGELHPDSGDCLLPADWRIAHMRQEVDTLERLAVDYVLDGDLRLREVQRDLAAAEEVHDGAALARLHAELDSADGYTADARARKLLAGLGFTNEQMDRQVGDFSGGWRMRLNLAQALMCPSDLLLLDEPTNHLDLEMRLALTMALQEFSGAVLVVSHDRHLLKSTTDNFFLVADGKVEEFDGDLEDYARWLVEYRQRNAPVSNTPVNPDKTDKKAQRQAAAALRQQLAPHKREADKLEAELGKLHEKLAKVDASLGDSDLYEPARKNELRDLLAEQAKLKVREGELEEAWMQALETLETMQAELEALS